MIRRFWEIYKRMPEPWQIISTFGLALIGVIAVTSPFLAMKIFGIIYIIVVLITRYHYR